MSKIIEALKVRSSHIPKDKTPEIKPREVQIEKTSHELTQEQLAEIYFSATGKTRTQETPLIIRVVERPRFATFIPWLIACLAFAITLFSFFSTKKILVDVKILDEKIASHYSLDRKSLEEEAAPKESGQNFANNADNNAKSPIQRFLTQNIIFEGAAFLNSSKDKNGALSLINSSVAPFARATLRLDPPQDLSQSKIIFYAKGGRGGETVAFALKDKDNIQGFYKGKIFPFPDRLSTSWQKAEIDIDHETMKDFDPRSVTSLRFEFGSKDTGNKPGDLVLIKDLQWTHGGTT